MALDPLGVGDENLPNDEAGNLTEGPPPMDIGESPSIGEPAPLPGEQSPPPPSPWLHPFTPNPETQPGGQDYSQPLPPIKPVQTDLSTLDNHVLDSDELNALAGHPGLLHTLGEELGTKAGLMQKVPIFGQLPEATRAVQAYMATQRLQKGNYPDEKSSENDVRMVTGYLNETRLRQKMDENRTFAGEAVQAPLRMIPFALEIGLAAWIGKRKGLKALMGEEAGANVEMSATRLGAVNLINKWIGAGGEKLLAKHLERGALERGLGPALAEWNKAGDVVQQGLVKQARQGLLKNIANRNLPEMIGRLVPEAEVNVAQELIDNSAALRWSSRAIESAINLPFIAAPRLMGAGATRQLQRMNISQDPTTQALTFHDTGETLTDSALKGITSEYVNYLSMYSGGEISNFMKKGIMPHLASLKLAELASQLPGGAPIVDRIQTIMGSQMIRRGFTVASRLMNEAGRKLAVWDPISLVGMMTVNKTAQSMLNLDDDGETPWATRVVRSMADPVLNPKTTLANILGFSILPVGLFAHGALSGSLSDAEFKANRDYMSKLMDPEPGQMFAVADRKENTDAARVLSKIIMSEKESGLSTSLFYRAWGRIFNQPVKLRPGTVTELLSRTPEGQDLNKSKDILTKLTALPEEQRVQLLGTMIELNSAHVVIDNWADLSAGDKNVYMTLVGLGKLEQTFREQLTKAGVEVPLKSAVSREYIPTSLEERKAGAFTAKGVRGQLSLKHMDDLIEQGVKQMQRPDSEVSPAEKELLGSRIHELQRVSNQFRDTSGNWMATLSPHVEIYHPEFAKMEREKTGPFKDAVPINQAMVAEGLDKNPTLRRAVRRGNMSPEMLDALNRATKAGDPTREFYYLPAVGRINEKGQREHVFGSVFKAGNGRPDRIYLTDTSEPSDVPHEVAHEHDADLRRRVVASLLEERKENLDSEKNQVTQGWTPRVFAYLNSIAPLDEHGKPVPVVAYLEALLAKREDVHPSPQFKEDLANLMSLYLGYGHESDRPGMDAPKLLYRELEGNIWFRSNMEKVIAKDKVLQSLQKNPVNPIALLQTREDIQAIYRAREAKAGVAPAAAPAVSPVVAPPAVEVEPAVPAKPLSPAEVAAKGVVEKVPVSKEQNAKDQVSGRPAAFKKVDPGTFSSAVADEAPVQKGPAFEDHDLYNMARLLSLRRADLTSSIKNGELEWSALEELMVGKGMVSRLLPVRLQEAYGELKLHHPEMVKSIILGDSAEKWLTRLRDVRKAAAAAGIEAKPPVDEGESTGAISGSVTYMDQEQKLESTMKQIANFVQLHDASYGADFDLKPGRKEMPIRMHQSPLLREIFASAMKSKGDFERMLADPTKWLLDAAKGANVPEDLKRYWEEHLAPTLHVHTYDEMMNPNNGRTLGETLAFTALPMTWGLVRDSKTGELTGDFEVLNRNTAAKRKWAAIANAKLREVFQQDLLARPTGEGLNPWIAEANKAKAASPLFSKLSWKATKEMLARANAKEAADTNTPQEKATLNKFFNGKITTRGLLMEGLRMFHAFMPSEKMGLELEDMLKLLDNPKNVRGVAEALSHFARLLDLSTFSKDNPPAQAFRRLQEMLVGNWDVTSAILEPAMRDKYPSLTTQATVASQRRDARVGDHLINTVNRPHNIDALHNGGMLDPESGRVDLTYLRGERRGHPDAFGDRVYGTTTKEWTDTDRALVDDMLFEQAYTSKDEHPMIQVSIAPMGNNTLKVLFPMRFMRTNEEAIRAYSWWHPWLGAHGGTDGVTPLEDYVKRFRGPSTKESVRQANEMLHTAIIHRMVMGVYPKDPETGVLKNILNLIKRTSQITLANAPGKLASADGIRNTFNTLLYQTLYQEVTPFGVNVTEAKTDYPWMDGQHALTEAGSASHGGLTSLKLLIHEISDEYQPTMIKGNAVLVNESTMPGLRQAFKDMNAEIATYNAAHPDDPIHMVTSGDSAKLIPQGTPAALKLFSVVDGKVVYNKGLLGEAPFLVRVKPESVGIASDLKETTEVGPVTIDKQMLAGVNIADRDLIKDVIFGWARELQSRLPELNGDFASFKKAMENYWRPDNAADQVLKGWVDGGYDIRNEPRFTDQIAQLIWSKLRRSQPTAAGIRSQMVGPFVDSEFAREPEPSVYRSFKTGKILTGADLANADPNTVALSPGDAYVNVKNRRVEKRFTFGRMEADTKTAVLGYLWEHRNKWPDIFQSEKIVDPKTGDTQFELKQQLMPDVWAAIKPESEAKGDGRVYTITLRGELYINHRTPDTGAESTSIYRLKSNIGTGDDSNFVIVNGRHVILAGEDLDGDSRFGYLAVRDKNGNVVGHHSDFTDSNGRVQITLPKGQKWSEGVAGSLHHFIQSRGMMYPGENPEYFRPAGHVDPLERHLTTDTFKGLAKEAQEKLLAPMKCFNSPEAIKLSREVAGKMNALPVAVKSWSFLQEMLNNKIYPKEERQFRIPGIDHTFQYGPGGPSDHIKVLLRNAGGDIEGMVADTLKDLYAPSLHMEKNYIGLFYAVLLSNRLLEHRLKSEVADGNLLKSIEGTVQLLRDHLFSDKPTHDAKTGKAGLSMLKLLEDALPSGTLTLHDDTQGILWQNNGIKALLAYAKTLKVASGEHDLHRSIDGDAAARFGERSPAESKPFGTFVFDDSPGSPYRSSRNMARSQEVVDRGNALIPKATGLFDNAPKLVKDILAANPELEKKYAKILNEGIWEHADNPVIQMLSPTGGTARESTPDLSRNAGDYDNLEFLQKSFAKLPDDIRHALALHELSERGLSGLDFKGSYANLIPATDRIWLAEEARKIRAAEKISTPGERGAAAPASVEGRTPPPDIKNTPGAGPSETPRIEHPIETMYDRGSLPGIRVRNAGSLAAEAAITLFSKKEEGKIDAVYAARWANPQEIAKAKEYAQKQKVPFYTTADVDAVRDKRIAIADGTYVETGTERAAREKAAGQLDLPGFASEQLASLHKELLGTEPKAPATQDPVPNFSSAVADMTDKLAYRAAPIAGLHKEMQLKFAIRDRLIDSAYLALNRLLRSSDDQKHGLPTQEALFYLINRLKVVQDDKHPDGLWKLDPKLTFEQQLEQAGKIRGAGNIGWHYWMTKGKEGEPPDRHTEFVDESNSQSVKDVVHQYEAYRKAHPEAKLASFEDLVGQARPILENVRRELNKHAGAFTDSGELLANISKRTGMGYVHQATTYPWAKDLGEQLRAKLNEWYSVPHKPGEYFDVVIHPMDPEALVTSRRISADKASVKSQGFDALSKLSLAEQDKEIERIVQAAKDEWKKEAARPEPSMLTEAAGEAAFRTSDLEEQFTKYGRIPRNPNFAKMAEHYVAQVADFAASKRFLSYMANITDGLGTPAAFFTVKPGKEFEDEQDLLSNTTLRSMFNNWRNRMLLDDVKESVDNRSQPIRPYDNAATIWDNLRRLESIASASLWFDNNHYQRVVLKNAKNFASAWVLEGPARQLLDHVTSRGIEDLNDTGVQGVTKRTVKGMIWFAQFTKQIGLAFSLFHAATLMESHVSSYGITGANPVLKPWRLLGEIRKAWQTSQNALTDPAQREHLSDWMKYGLTFRFADPNISFDTRSEGGPLDSFLSRGIEALDKIPVAGQALAAGFKGAQWLKRSSDHMLWEVLQPASKLMMADRLYNDILANPNYDRYTGTQEGRETVQREIAQATNQVFGGINWHEQIWATPLMRDIIRAVVFAPDWTLSCLQTAMVPDALQRVTGVKMPFGPTGTTDIRSKFLLEKYWPAFIYVTLMMVPAAWQAGIYSAFGDKDKGDNPWLWMNEEGKEMSIDMTPIYRALGKKFGKTETRRAYMQWGKSGYEIGGWFKDPWKTFLGKTSQPVKVLWEQLTGRNTAGWDMPWAKEDAEVPFGGLFMVDRELSKSRLAYVAQKFVPMTIMNMLKGEQPSTLFAPSGLGINSFKAEHTIADVIQTYSDESLWYQLKGQPDKVKRLETLARSTFEAARLNGYEPKKILTTAEQMVHARFTKEFFAELEAHPKAPNLAKLEKIARAAQRSQMAVKAFYNAINRDYTTAGRTITDRQRGAMQESWQNAQENQGEQP